MHLLSMVLAVAATAFGQSAASGVISGTVIEAATNEPVRKSVVTLTLQQTPRAWATARTDAAGHFRFDGLPPGKYALRAVKDDMGTALYGAGTATEVGELITLGASETRTALTLRMVRSAIVSGRAYEAGGGPVSGVAIRLLRATRNLGERILIPAGSATTNDRGEYRITRVAPGEYYAVASSSDFQGAVIGEGQEVFSDQYFSGAREAKDAAVLNVKSGENRAGVDFNLIAERPQTIRGHVTGVPVKPSSIKPETHGDDNSVVVEMSPAEENAVRWSNGLGVSPPDYRFDFGKIPAGIYRVEAEFKADGKVWSASQVVDIRQSPGDLLLALEPAIDIKGQLKVESATPQKVSGYEIKLVRRGDRAITATTGADGRFALMQVPPGEWMMNIATMPPGGFLKSANFGKTDVRFIRLNVEPRSEASLNIVLSTNTAKVAVEVDAGSLDSKRGGVVLAPTGKFHTLLRFYYGAPVSADGKYVFENIAPGKYKAFALEKLAARDFRNPEAIDQLADLGTEFEAPEGATVAVHPKLIPMKRALEALPPGLRQ